MAAPEAPPRADALAAFVLRAQVEDFLYHEAQLLDSWQLMEWAALFTEDAEYAVPSTDLAEDADPRTNLFLVHDDRFRIEQRAKRLLKKTAHAEFPPSRTRHLVSNVRIEADDGNALQLACATVVYRAKRGIVDVYPGHAKYELLRDGGTAGFRIRRKRAILDIDALRPQGKLSIIL
ncbi:MAG: aromatic-ring-hydroxylating dioxygenase subunit beta [Sneathiellaceae bacterium]